MYHYCKITTKFRCCIGDVSIIYIYAYIHTYTIVSAYSFQYFQYPQDTGLRDRLPVTASWYQSLDYVKLLLSDCGHGLLGQGTWKLYDEGEKTCILAQYPVLSVSISSVQMHCLTLILKSNQMVRICFRKLLT